MGLMAHAKGDLRALQTFIMVFGLVANAVVILVVLASGKMRRSAMNLLLANLALANFLILFHSASARTYHIVTGTSLLDHWPYSSWLCTSVAYFRAVCWLVNVTTFVVIAVERWAWLYEKDTKAGIVCVFLGLTQFRYVVVVHPLKARYVDCGHMARIIFGIWLLSLAFTTPHLFCYLVKVTKAQTRHGDCRSCLNTCSGTTAHRVYKGIQVMEVSNQLLLIILFV